MKKGIFLLTAALLLLLAACGGGSAEDAGESGGEAQETAPVELKIAALKGPTAMGMAQLMDAAESGEFDDAIYDFTLAGAADEVLPMVVNGTADIACVPANMASILYNRTEGEVEVAAINTLGVLYIVERGNSVESVEDLRGKTIYASGQGATPEYALSYILENNGISPAGDVTLEWKSEHAECLSALLSDESGIAMLPQPFVTTAMNKAGGLRIALDLNEEWEKLQEGEASPSALVTGVCVVRKSFAEEEPEALESFLKRYKASIEYVNSNISGAAELIGKYDIVPAEVAEKAIPACNMVYIDGAEMKSMLGGYLSVLFEQNPQAVGAALPGEDFYYGAS